MEPKRWQAGRQRAKTAKIAIASPRLLRDMTPKVTVRRCTVTAHTLYTIKNETHAMTAKRVTGTAKWEQTRDNTIAHANKCTSALLMIPSLRVRGWWVFVNLTEANLYPWCRSSGGGGGGRMV